MVRKCHILDSSVASRLRNDSFAVEKFAVFAGSAQEFCLFFKSSISK